MPEQIINLTPTDRATGLLHIPIDLHRRFKAVAAQDGISIQALATELVQTFLDARAA